MRQLRKSRDRGHADHGWLDTYHTFSFAGYYDPAHMGFRSLRVINEDRVQPGMGFGMHGHQDMEIVTYVLEGELEHKDSMGNGEVLRPGEFQRMSAGSGIRHSEFNPSATAPVHLYQIWVLPNERGLEPSYDQRTFEPDVTSGRLFRVASGHGHEGVIPVHQDVEIFLGKFEPGRSATHALDPDRHAWLQVLRGRVSVNGNELTAGDGAAISAETSLDLTAVGAAEVGLFDRKGTSIRIDGARDAAALLLWHYRRNMPDWSKKE